MFVYLPNSQLMLDTWFITVVIVNTECFKYANDMLKNTIWSSGCGTVGRVVASYTRDLRFESSHQQYTITCIGKKKVKKKRPRTAHYDIDRCWATFTWFLTQNLVSAYLDGLYNYRRPYHKQLTKNGFCALVTIGSRQCDQIKIAKCL